MWIRASITALAMSCGGLVLGAVPASAGGLVDPSTLFPEPPPGAICRANGAGVICETTFNGSVLNEPAFPLPCGLIYESSDDVRRGVRWYVDGRLTQRFVFQNAAGSWSLSPTGDGPSVTLVAHDDWQNRSIDASTPEETWSTTSHGMILRITGPDGRPIFQYTGLEHPDGTHSGLGSWVDLDSPEIQSTICNALTS
jgi:hypothetical protein